MNKRKLIVLGRFPPPIDGQTVITARFLEMLRRDYEVAKIDMSPFSNGTITQRLNRLVSLKNSLREAGAYIENTLVLWCSISPNPLGHLRDFLTVYPHLRSVPTIAVVHHGNFDDLFRNPATLLSGRRIIASLERVVLLEPRLADNVSEWISEQKRATIPNPPDIDYPQNVEHVNARLDKGPSDPLKILFLSNMIESKGYLDLAKAAVILRGTGLRFHIHFVGSWIEGKDKFNRLVQDQNLGDLITATGPIADRTLIRDLHLHADVFVLPTSYPTEAQPVSIIEALEAGTPIVTCKQGGIPDMVRDDKEAIFVHSGNPQEIADAIASLTEPGRWRRMAENSRERFVSNFDADIIRRKWATLLQSVS